MAHVVRGLPQCELSGSSWNTRALLPLARFARTARRPPGRAVKGREGEGGGGGKVFEDADVQEISKLRKEPGV
jgi:hypothetical protein